MKLKKSSIKWKFFLYLIGFTGILLGLLWYFQIVHLNSFYTKIKKSELNKAADELLDDIGSGNLDKCILSLADEYDISINLTDNTGKSIYNANMMETSHIYIFSKEQFDEIHQKASDNGGSIFFEVSGKYRELQDDDSSLDPVMGDKEPMFKPDDKMPFDKEGLQPKPSQMNLNAKSMVYVKLITDSNGDECVLLMSSLITPVDATVFALRKQFILISVIFIVLAVSLAFVISQTVSRPIVKINNSAKKLADGDFDVKFNEKSYKEVHELSKTLNYAAEELGRTEKLRKELIANVSHDLRTPLTMITAYSEVMRDIPGENNPENVQVIIDEAKRLTTLVNDMLDLSKLESGVMKLNLQPFDFTKSIIGVMNRFSKLTEQSGYNIKFEYSDNARVVADEYKIFQVIYNLINNAINYSGEDKTVIVRQIVHGDIVRLEVEDHGDGISESEIKNIWDRYYKVDKTHKRAVQGTGLGLSIVCNILKLHDAKFGVNSTLTKGSIFWFELKTEDSRN